MFNRYFSCLAFYSQALGALFLEDNMYSRSHGPKRRSGLFSTIYTLRSDLSNLFKFLMIFRPDLYIIRVTVHSSGKFIMKQATLALLLVFAFALGVSAQRAKPTPKITRPPTSKTVSTAAVAKPCTGKNDLTQAEVTTILDKHNSVRAALGLPKLIWSCQLADMAQEWATRGVFQHRDTRMGESIYSSSQANIPVQTGFDKWMSEKAFWNNDSAVCQAGKVCTHYTQIVWRKTTEIGCGITRKGLGDWKTLMVCNYNPGGNLPGKAF